MFYEERYRVDGAVCSNSVLLSPGAVPGGRRCRLNPARSARHPGNAAQPTHAVGSLPNRRGAASDRSVTAMNGGFQLTIFSSLQYIYNICIYIPILVNMMF